LVYIGIRDSVFISTSGAALGIKTIRLPVRAISRHRIVYPTQISEDQIARVLPIRLISRRGLKGSDSDSCKTCVPQVLSKQGESELRNKLRRLSFVSAHKLGEPLV
jgi:hypothetical protein